MKAIILSLSLPTQIIQITHLWVITHRLGTTAVVAQIGASRVNAAAVSHPNQVSKSFRMAGMLIVPTEHKEFLAIHQDQAW